jgi:uncharacterized protein (DUF362 family)
MSPGTIQEPCEFELAETMWGYVSKGAASPKEGYEQGKKEGNRLEYKVTLHVEDFQQFTSPAGRRAPMTGWVTCKNLFEGRLPIENAEYGLYWTDPASGERRISYDFSFTDAKGTEYHFYGYKVIDHALGSLDLMEDQTTLFATISTVREGEKKEFAKGIIHYHVEDFPQMLLSVRTPKDNSLLNRLRMTREFFDFVFKEIRSYFDEVNLFYKVEYYNVVFRGILTADGKDHEFFFFSGVHDKGFPWGDNIGFWDIALVLKEGDSWRRFALTKHAIENLEYDFPHGKYHHRGPVYEILRGHQVSFSDMHEVGVPEHLRKVDADIEFQFRPTLIADRKIPFTMDPNRLEALPENIREEIESSESFKNLIEQIKNAPGLGYRTRVHRLTDIQGTFKVNGATYTIQRARTLGEGEHGELTGLRKPTLYYNYFCSVQPESDLFRVHARSGILRTLGADPVTNEFENMMGDILGQIGRMDLLVKQDQGQDMDPEEGDTLIEPEADLLEINNDHYPTATFQRRIVALPGLDEEMALALEEDMSVIDPAAINSTETAAVAAIRDLDRFNALDRVLEATDFFGILDKAQSGSGKTKEDFSIIVKPNFSFMYSLTDVSTFTDPDLVEHLVDRIYEKGYRNIAVAEAQSTYTVMFANRDVPTLAKYIGLNGKNYKVIDLSEDTVEHVYEGVLGTHEVHPAWRDADFRISFAKNKTHSYAFYTLTIKNIYGALPRKNKFKEYHCNEELGIYEPTIDFLKAFPVHFGLIDAYFSADGAFGIFADVQPNFTSTVIGGDNLVAVDWVGASKMGYDPMISEYIERAVSEFGKPEIRLIGDSSLYRTWRNVPEPISQAAFGIMDRNYTFGSFLYSMMGTMDPFFRFKPTEVSRRIARLLMEPIRKILFESVSGRRDGLTWQDIRKMLDPEQLEYVERLIASLFE